MENSVQKLIEEIAQIAEKYDVVSRCVIDIRRLKEKYQSHHIIDSSKFVPLPNDPNRYIVKNET